MMSRLWTQDPEAAALIASCVARRPEMKAHTEHYGCTAETTLSFTGRRVRRLKAIATRYRVAALTEGDKTGDYASFHANCITIDEAIESAIAAAPKGRLAREAVAVIARERIAV